MVAALYDFHNNVQKPSAKSEDKSHTVRAKAAVLYKPC